MSKDATQPNCIFLAEHLRSIAQAGLSFCENPFDRERYEQILELSAKIIATHVNASHETILQAYLADSSCLTPKLDTRGAIFQANNVLLVQEKADNLWSLPGGWVDLNESLSDAITREIFEEIGFKTEPIKLAAVIDKRKYAHPNQMPHVYKALFVCQLLEATPNLNHEILDLAWFPIDELPSLSTGRILPEQIQLLYEHYLQPNLPTKFD